MEKIIFAGKITHIELKTSQSGNNYLNLKVERKNIWLDKTSNSWKEQIISRTMVTGLTTYVQMFQNGLLANGDYVVVEGNVKAETYQNNNGETKAAVNINLLHIENLSWRDKTIGA